MGVLRDRITRLTDGELLEIIQEKFALEIAKQELSRREICFTDKSELFPPPDESSPNMEEIGDIVGAVKYAQDAKYWRWVSFWVAAVVMIVWFLVFASRFLR